MNHPFSSRKLLCFSLFLALGTGCDLVLGLDEFTNGTTGGQGGGGGATSSSASATTTGAGGANVCSAGEVVACSYAGPAGTEGKGLCVAGTRQCNKEGTAFGDCAGEVQPATEDCANTFDDDCDGNVNNGCPCKPGVVEACYGGPEGTEGVGICRPGMHTCTPDGLGFGPCLGEQRPLAEDCATPDDDDCNGTAIDPGAGCVCAPTVVSPCYDGPQGSENVGICVGGSHTCQAMGKGYDACVGQVLPAVELCTALGDEDCDGVGCSEHRWSKVFGDLSDQFPNFIASDSGGNLLVAGGISGSTNFGGGALISAGNTDAFIAKLDSSGVHQWSLRAGDADEQTTNSVIADSDGNVIIAGYFIGTINLGGANLVSAGGYDAFVAKFSAAGAHLWSSRHGGVTDDQFVSVGVDGTGAIVVAGTATNAGDQDILIKKYSGAGVVSWTKQVAAAGNQSVSGVAVHSGGSIYVTGALAGSVNLDGTVLTSAGGDDMFVAKLDTNGTFVATSKRFGDVANQAGDAIAVDSNGNIIVCGNNSGTMNFGGGNLTSAGGADIIVAKLTTDSLYVWSKRFGDAANQFSRRIAVDASDNVLLTGELNGSVDFGGGVLSSAGGADMYLAKLSPAGTHLWSKRFGSANQQIGRGVAAAPNGKVFVAAYGQGSMSLGGGALVSAGAYDIFLASFEP